jgi:putative SOS response-associated peptidase YedK
MCGRAYSTITEEELEMRYSWERLKRNPLGLKPNYNLSPTQMAPIVFAARREDLYRNDAVGFSPALGERREVGGEVFSD